MTDQKGVTITEPTRPWYARCACGHLWLRHDVKEYFGDDSELCCVEGCAQVGCPGRTATAQEPEFTSPAYDAFQALTVEQRAALADAMFRILEFDGEGKPGAVWSSDTPQAMGDLLHQRHGIDFTPPSGADW